MLHLHNGDCSAGVARRSDLAGEHAAWREALMAGPTPALTDRDEWRRVRATHLSEAYGLRAEDCLADLSKQDEMLRSFADHEEVVLWFEHDLFCQINLLYLLHWFSAERLGKTRLSLVCVDRYPGIDNFRGLGQLDPAQMSALFHGRREVTENELLLAKIAWKAYCSASPVELQTLLSGDTSPLPFLRDALALHLARFPSTRNGLGRIENTALGLIRSGSNRFMTLFGDVGAAEPIYGMGDAQLWNDLKRMTSSRRPLLSTDKSHAGDDVADSFIDRSFQLTATGEAVLAGRDDFINDNEIDYWLGGVHLTSGDILWRWDEKRQKIVA